MKYPPVQNYIGGKFVTGSGESFDVFSPLDGTVIAQSNLSTKADVASATGAAKLAFPAWSAMPIKERVQVFFKYKTLLEKHSKELSELIQEENGKTFSEAQAEIDKSIELTEFACSMPQLASGELLEVSRGVECRIERYPVGVVACITPFNFPAMVPNWTIPNALVLGNTMILKPSELVPLSANRIAQLLKEAGLPDGVFNIVHGTKEVVEAICTEPLIDAISFVGSTKVAKIVYALGSSNFKRVLALGGAKNHLFVLPDAHPGMAASNIAASMSGCIDKLCDEARKIIPGHNLGAVISAEAKARIENYITEAENAGAKILVDGRHYVVAGKENGYYVGPTVIDDVTADMKIAQEEVFGPVLAILHTETLENALAIQKKSPYGNAASVFTQSGGAAHYVSEHASAGMIGVNIGVPVPREPFSFGGWNDSKFGVGDLTGKSSIEFWTKLKKTTTKWNPEAQINWMS
ncbi:MAG: aldehyde dehydrogenase family protein [Ignavibacteriales bacterium]|nr:aldehyde dehydrogenase family protein [Ignavibacteriales bacterium]